MASSDLGLIRRLESAAVRAWPPATRWRTADGWVLRATPGLSRARSNHALTPSRSLSDAELPEAIARVRWFADRHRIRPGIQVSPLDVHGRLDGELEREGWRAQFPVLVMTAPLERLAPERDLAIEVSDHADARWLETWGRCDAGYDVEAHARTVFAALQGRAAFARLESDAVAIAAADDGLVGVFCMAVVPSLRRRGLGGALLRGLLGRFGGELAYLQVEEDNLPARALYERHGFAAAYRYRHRVAPE